MSIQKGFGSYSEPLNSVVVLGVIQASGNRNLIVQLPSKNEKRIFDLTVGYSVIEGLSYNSVTRGRVLIVGEQYDGVTDYINPTTTEMPEALQASKKYFDAPLVPSGQDKNVHTEAILKTFSWINGLLIPSGIPASIILTFCMNDALDSQSAQEDTNAYLNVSGWVGGSDKIFKNA